MIGLKWHIVTGCLLLCLAFGGFSQSPGSHDARTVLQSTDTIESPQQERLDSLLKSAEQESVSLKHAYDSVASASSMALLRARAQIDSATALGFDTDHLIRRLDSMKTSRAAKLDSIAGRVGTLQGRVNEKLSRLDLPPRVIEETKSWMSKLGELQQQLDTKQVRGIAGYRFTDRLTSGAGWRQRIAYNSDVNTFSSCAVISGPRGYGEYRIGKGIIGRLEIECMNTHVPAAFSNSRQSQ